MNKRNNWKGLLDLANADLAKVKSNKTIKITDYYHDGCYTCEICEDGVSKAVYAENYYEEELSDLIHDAWTYCLTN
jgi:hypothetical protein